MPWFSIVHSFLKSNAEIADTDSTIPYLKLLQQRLAEESSECVDKNPTIIAEKSEENSAKMSQSIEAIKIPVKKKKRLQKPPACIGVAMAKLEQIRITFSSETHYLVQVLLF